MCNEEKRTWQEIAAEASTETDPEKLVKAIDELCGVLDKQRAEAHKSELS